MEGFKIPSSDYDNKSGEPNAYDLRAQELRTYTKKGYPNERLRYRDLENNLYEVEIWLENNVKGKGVLGRGVSKLVARYTVKRTKVKGGVSYRRIGTAKSWYFDGSPRGRYEYKIVKADSIGVFKAEFDPTGRLTEYEDKRRGEGNVRSAKFQHDANGRRVVGWRGKFHSKSTSYNEKVTVRKNDAGLPLNDNGDYTERTYVEGILVTEESFVAGKQDGFSRTFNKFGRVILESWWCRGKEVPEWMYLDPKGITPEEIQDESDDELRAIMLELQGTEVYQVRAMARGARAVSRALIAEADSQMTSVTLSRAKLTEV